MSEHPPGRYRSEDEVVPPAKRVTDQVVIRFEDVYEVDPARMREFPQQAMPAWDTRRIVAARWDHLEDVHGEFADGVILADQGPDVET